MSGCSIEFGSDNAEKAHAALITRNIPDLEVVIGSNTQLLIDYDQEELPQERLDNGLSFLRERVGKGELGYNTFRSGSGKHWHVVVEMPIEMTELERITWQLIFGSDHKRDALSVIGINRMVKNPILLFMHKNKKPEMSYSVPEKPARKFK